MSVESAIGLSPISSVSIVVTASPERGTRSTKEVSPNRVPASRAARLKWP